MKHLTVGVAGHIDHGKTALVRALTGTETDRLQEEQARGMSIVLGFAHLTLPSGEIDLIDVPGHEKFVKTMIAGATGIDSALLVVAANERIKPQTVEHVALMGLLGVTQGIVAVTKSDLVADPEAREAVENELRAFLAETFLRDAPRVFVSAVTGEGLTALVSALEGQLAETETRPEHASFTLPVDRAFTITGHGTVVTGTLRRGKLTLGQTVEILPGGGRAEVRGLEVHGQPVTTAHSGWRTAVNLRGIKKEEISPGNTLATPGSLRPTRIIDAEAALLASAAKPLKRGQWVVLHHGTSEFPARVYPLGSAEIPPGETMFVQMRLSADTVAAYGEPFVLRLPSPAETVGGGRVLDPYPARHTRLDEDILARMQVLASGTPAERFSVKLEEAGAVGADSRQLAQDYAVPDDAVTQDLPLVPCGPTLAVHRAVFERLTAQVIEILTEFHGKHHTRRGIPAEELRRRLPRLLPPAVYQTLIAALVKVGTLETVDGLVRQAGYNPSQSLSAIEQDIAAEIAERFRTGGLKPPEADAVVKRDRRRKALYYYLIEAGILVRAAERATDRSVVFHRDAVAEAVSRLHEVLSDETGLTVSELDQQLGTTRKFSIPLLEHLDSLGVTRREGDLRYWNGNKKIDC